MTNKTIAMKSANTTTANTPKVTAKGPEPKATPKVTATPKAQAVKATPKASTPKVEYATSEQVQALASMIRGQNARIDAVETENAVLRGQCELLERLIVGFQTSQALASHAPVETVEPKAKALATKAAEKAHTEAPKAQAAKVSTHDLETLLTETVESVIDGINADRYADKVIPQCDSDLRGYASMAIRKALKAYRNANDGITLKDLSEMIVAKFEELTGEKASEFAR